MIPWTILKRHARKRKSPSASRGFFSMAWGEIQHVWVEKGWTKTSLRIFYRPTILVKSLCRHNTVAIFGRKTASYFFRKKYLSLTLTGFCVPKRVGYGHPFSSLRASQEFVLFGRGCLCHDIPNATVDFSCTSTRVCWAYHQLCWSWNLVFRPSAKSNRHQCLLCASEWTLIPHPTPPHPTPPHPLRDVKPLQRSMTYVRKCKWTCRGVTW